MGVLPAALPVYVRGERRPPTTAVATAHERFASAVLLLLTVFGLGLVLVGVTGVA